MAWPCWCKEHLGQDPLSGDLFVFRSKRGDKLKMLYWQEDGYCLFYKRQGACRTHLLLFTESD
jgi:transposase